MSAIFDIILEMEKTEIPQWTVNANGEIKFDHYILQNGLNSIKLLNITDSVPVLTYIFTTNKDFTYSGKYTTDDYIDFYYYISNKTKITNIVFMLRDNLSTIKQITITDFTDGWNLFHKIKRINWTCF